MTQSLCRRTAFHGFFALLLLAALVRADAPATGAEKLLPVTRIPWPEETYCLEMFSAMTQGPDGVVYSGTCNAKEKERLGAMLISLDPDSGKQEVLVDVHQVTGEQNAATFPQSKIHSQICFGADGVAWFGTHSYQWNTFDQFRENPGAYSGGYLISYDPKARKATSHGILVPHESIMSLALAESVGKVYCVLHPTGRFVVYDIATKKTADKGAILDYPSRTTVALKDGRGYTFTKDGHVVRYSPKADKLEKLSVAVPLFEGETDRAHNNPFALAVSADEKSIYGVGWTSGLLFEYRPDDGPEGSIRSLGPAFGDAKVPGKRKDLCIAMATGTDGRIYYAGYAENPGRVACYDPKTGERIDLGRMAPDGKPLPPGAGCAGGMCALRDGRIVVADFDQKQTYYNIFTPPKLDQ